MPYPISLTSGSLGSSSPDDNIEDNLFLHSFNEIFNLGPSFDEIDNEDNIEPILYLKTNESDKGNT